MPEDSEVKEELVRIRIAMEGHATQLKAIGETQAELVKAYKDLVRVDTEQKNTEKSVAVLWKDFRASEDKTTEKFERIFWRVGLLAGAAGMVGGFGGTKLFGG